MQPRTNLARYGLMLLLALAPQLLPAADDLPAEQDYTVKVWGADEGLTESSVTDVAQTPEGYLWVGTLFGSVLRFDGTRFVRYNSANAPQFSLKWGIPRFMVDSSGTLWISMYDGGMTTWDQNGFLSAFASTNQPDRMLWSAPGRVVFVYSDGKLLSGRKQGDQWDWTTNAPSGVNASGQHCADANGRIWYVRGKSELGVWDGAQTTNIAPLEALGGTRIRVLTVDAQGRIWVGTDKGFGVWEKDHFTVMTPTNGEAELNVRRIIPSGNGSLWVEADGRLRRCFGRQWLAECDNWQVLESKRISFRFLHGDSEGGLWAASGDMGLIHISPGGGFHRFTTRDGLPSNAVHFAYEDREGNIWTGYERGGLVRLRRRLFRNIGPAQGLGDSLVNTVSEDPGGAIWIGTHSGVVGRYQNGVFTNIPISLPGADRAQDSCVAADERGRVWIGAQNVGLLRYENGEMQTIATQAQLQAYPRLLLPGRDGELWVGTLWSIIRVTNGGLDFQYTSQTVGGHPTALAQVSDGSIWAGTLDGILLHGENGKFVPVEPPDRTSLGRIWTLWPGSDGGLWAGTEEGGLLHWNNGKFRRYTMKNGLPSDSIEQVMSDRAGNLWLGTRAGIVRILGIEHSSRSQLENLSLYGQSDGLQTIGSAIIYQPNCWRGRDGQLLFAMSGSVAEIKPDAIHVNPLPPTVALEELKADGKTVWPQHVGGIITPSSEDEDAPPPNIEVGPGHADLEFLYTGLSLGSPLHVRFKYRLEGLENAWNDAGDERKAVYRRVPPGSYVLHVIAANSDGVLNQKAALLTVTVLPYFYQTTWFFVLSGVLLAAALIAVVAMAMRRRMHARLELLRQQHGLERERSRIAQDLHDDLGAGLTEISLLGGMLQDPTRLSARKDEALGRIVQRCHALVTALDEIVWALNPQNDSVNSLAGYLSRYAQGFLETTDIRCRLEVEEAEPDHPFNSEQRHNLFLAFKETLTNVVKHSGADEVRVKIAAGKKTGLIISIEDNGRGLPAGNRAADGADGLNNLRSRLDRIGGQCEIINRPSGGVAVILRLPLEHFK